MAKVGVIEARLQAWARWRGRPKEHDAAPPGPESEIEEVVALLPPPLRAAVERLYLETGDIREHARELGCPPWTITRRIGRAHQVLLEQLRSKHEKAQRQREAVEMGDRVNASRRAGATRP